MDKGIGLVLAGGGAKGSYQVGAWQALREMGIEFGAVIGTSVGALNAALVAQGDQDLAEELWREVNIKNVIQWQGDQTAEPDASSLIKNDLFLLSRFIRGGAFVMDPLRELVEKYLDEDAIRASGIELGLVTFNLSDMKPHIAFLPDIPVGRLSDWLLASACFPAFKPLEMDGKKFVDGAVYNNFPVEPLYERGYRHVISIDLSGLGRVPAFEAPDLLHIRIRNSEFLGGTLQFSPEISVRNMVIGYCDALKVYGKMGGCRYNYRCEPAHRQMMIGPHTLDDVQSAVMSRLSRMTVRRLLHRMRTYSDCRHATLNVALELTAELLEIDRFRIYTMESFLEAIHEQLEALVKTRILLARNPSEGLWDWVTRLSTAKEMSITAILQMQTIGAGLHLDEVATLGKATFLAVDALTMANPDFLIAALVIHRLLKGFGIEDLPTK